MGPCIAHIFQYISNKMQLYTVYLCLETALHVSGVTSTHHQEHIQLYLQQLHPKHVQQFPDINKLCKVASGWIYIGMNKSLSLLWPPSTSITTQNIVRNSQTKLGRYDAPPKVKDLFRRNMLQLHRYQPHLRCRSRPSVQFHRSNIMHPYHKIYNSGLFCDLLKPFKHVHRDILLPNCLRSPHQHPLCSSPLPLTCYMPCPSHSSWFEHPN